MTGLINIQKIKKEKEEAEKRRLRKEELLSLFALKFSNILSKGL